MNNSHLLGFVTFGAFALFALLAWVASLKHPEIVGKPAMRRKTQRTALFLLVLGPVLGYFAFSIDNGMRITTLHEEMVEGSVGVSPDTPAPVRTVGFTVEHPGVEHELFLCPRTELTQPPQSAVDVAFSLHGPDGKVLLPERTEHFAVYSPSRNERADWDGETFLFTPAVAGAHTLRVTPLMVGIPRIQVRIADPWKRDGKRMPGY